MNRPPSVPAALRGGADEAALRFPDAARVEVPGEVARRIAGACAETSADVAGLADTGRDWWPLGLRWATHGIVPGRASLRAAPANEAEVAAVLAICNEARIPVTAYAGRSGVCGASVPVFGGVAMDMTGLAGLRGVDEVSLVADVLPGTYGPDLEAALRSDHDATLGHWPQSIDLSTVGGWLACRSAGQYSTRYGKIEDMVLGLDVALADGTVLHTGSGAPRAAAGPDLTQLFVGSEGTLGVVTGARLRLHPAPPHETRRAYGFGSFADGLDACRRILRRGATPAVLRLHDAAEAQRSFSTGDLHVVVVLDEGDRLLVEATIGVVDEECRGRGGNAAATALDEAIVATWLEHRNEVGALATLTEAHIVLDTAEVAASWRELPQLYTETIAALRALDGCLYASAHQSHAYTDGACLYFTFAGRGEDPDDLEWAEAFYRAAWDTVMAATTRHGGAISHHHGIGLNRARYLPAALGGGFEVLAGIKALLDPNGILNPGKLGLASPFGEIAWP